MAFRRKPPSSQSVARIETDNNLALALSHSSLSEKRPTRTLTEIAEQVRLSTGADGVAIALEMNGAVVCCARAGDCAPSVGALLDQASGLSGLCLRTGKPVRCDDTEADERVDASVARVLQIRSVVAVPVQRDWRVIGLIEVLARRPQAFGRKDVEELQAAAKDILRDVDEAADDTTSKEPGKIDTEAVPRATPEAQDNTASKLRALFSVNTKPNDAMADAPAVEEAAIIESEKATSKAAEADLQDAGAAPAETTAENAGLETIPLMSGFEAAQMESVSSSSNLRAVLAGVAGLALLFGLGLSAWRFTGSSKTPAKASVAEANAARATIEMLRTAAANDDAAAQYDLAIRYLKGDGVASSDSDAAAWLLKSAHLGNSSAQLQLGVAYELGRGVPQDFVKAYACYLIAGENGNIGSNGAQKALAPKLTQEQIADARALLGEMYHDGIGTPVDDIQSYMWFTLAEAAGSKEARREKTLLTTSLSKQQLAAANRRVAEWLSRNRQGPR